MLPWFREDVLCIEAKSWKIAFLRLFAKVLISQFSPIRNRIWRAQCCLTCQIGRSGNQRPTKLVPNFSWRCPGNDYRPTTMTMLEKCTRKWAGDSFFGTIYTILIFTVKIFKILLQGRPKKVRHFVIFWAKFFFKIIPEGFF